MTRRWLQYLNQEGGIDYLAKVAMLELAAPEIRLVRKFGKSASLTADTEADIWAEGGTKTLVTTAATLSIVSTSTSDTSAGVGAQYVLVDGLDANFEPQQALVAMNGTTPVVTTETFIRIQQMRVVVVGSTKYNVGIIRGTLTGDGVQAHIPVRRNLTVSSHLTIPNGYSGFLLGYTASVYRASGNTTARAVEFDIHVTAGDIQYESIQFGLRNDGGGTVQIKPSLPSYLPSQSTLVFAATADTTGTIASISHEVLLIKGEFNQYTGF